MIDRAHATRALVFMIINTIFRLTYALPAALKVYASNSTGFIFILIFDSHSRTPRLPLPLAPQSDAILCAPLDFIYHMCASARAM